MSLTKDQISRTKLVRSICIWHQAADHKNCPYFHMNYVFTDIQSYHVVTTFLKIIVVTFGI